MSGQAFTVTVAGGSRAYGRRGVGAHMTLHLTGCPIVKRAALVRPDYLSGWVAPDGRAQVSDWGGSWADTPAAVGTRVLEARGETPTYDTTERGMLAYARLWAENAAKGETAYRVCGRCKPEQALAEAAR